MVWVKPHTGRRWHAVKQAWRVNKETTEGWAVCGINAWGVGDWSMEGPEDEDKCKTCVRRLHPEESS